MTLEANNQPIEDDELSTTAPNPPDENVWKMPEPVFRRTSGKLPESYAKETAENGLGENSEPPNAPPAQPVAAAVVSPEPKPKNPALKIALVALGLGAMIAFLIVFLSIVYFLFLR